MKKVLLFTILIVGGFAPGQAQNSAKQLDRAKGSKHTSGHGVLPDQKAVWNEEQNYFRYLHRKDLKGFMSMWDNNFLGWPDYSEHPINKGGIESGIVEEFRTVQALGIPTPAPNPEGIGMFGDVAITAYFWPEADDTSPFKYRIMHTWQKGAHGWHIIGGMDCEVPRSSRPTPLATTTPDLQPSSAQDNDKAAVEATVRGYEEAVQQFDYDKVDSFLAPNAKWIERSAPETAAFNGIATGFWGEAKTTKVRLTNEPHDFDIHIQGDIAWVTLFVDVTTVADSEAARILLARTESEETGKSSDPTQREWRATYTESEVLVKTPNGWRIALGHTSRLPAKP